MAQNLLAVLGVGLLDPDTPVLRADDTGVTRGDGCFEGIRMVSDAAGPARAVQLDRHLARMTRSAAALELAFDEPAWRALIATACAAWTTSGEAALKLVLTRGPLGAGRPTGYLTVAPMPADYLRQRREGIRVITLDRGFGSAAFTCAPWLLGGVKTLSYATNMAAQREAEAQQAEDAILVSADGFVLEAPTASLVWSVGRTLHTTPTGGTGILAGTTQQLLFDNARDAGWRTADTLARVEELHDADTLWIVSSVRGPVEVIELDGKQHRRDPAIATEISLLAGF